MGKLVCRDEQRNLVHDAANQGAIASNPDALKFVRLYFRPKNSFHLKTEGIKFRGDPHRNEREMSIPILFLFNFSKVITQAGIGFSDGKLARQGAQPVFDEVGFNLIPFRDVYHDSAPPSSRMQEIHDRRMSEVVAPKELLLADLLDAVQCRTIYDEITLRYLTPGVPSRFSRLYRTSDNPPDLFMCFDTFIQLLEFQGDCLRMKLFAGKNYRAGRKIHCRIEQRVQGKLQMIADFDEVINNNSVDVRPFKKEALSEWTIYLEEMLAFKGILPYGKSELVKT